MLSGIKCILDKKQELNSLLLKEASTEDGILKQSPGYYLTYLNSLNVEGLESCLNKEEAELEQQVQATTDLVNNQEALKELKSFVEKQEKEMKEYILSRMNLTKQETQTITGQSHGESKDSQDIAEKGQEAQTYQSKLNFKQ